MDLCPSHCPLTRVHTGPRDSQEAGSEDAAIVLRGRLRQQIQDGTASRTNVTLGYPRLVV
jgi:hypothetical protein